MRIVAGKHAGFEGWVESAVFQRSGNHPEEFASGYHVAPDDWSVETAYTIRTGQPEL